MTAHNTGITYRRVGLLGVSLGRITTLRRRIALGRVPVRRPSQKQCANPGYDVSRHGATAGQPRKKKTSVEKLGNKPVSRRVPEPTRRGRFESEWPVQKPQEIGRNGGRKTYAWGGGGGPL
ncbi:hypothetical protein ASPTUDRAFT_920472 [Aspergillus tubingensis CBS 134.48]|uniref:Uncharacterized protein n=1 Tax=Aspergillus tubingensis (strain CBS 134.48) TaxID=767770 RepID=A0A1L9NFS8_ASPTC|nr:hypothetical protein ASPTUDRAFT_920472 [Aspergillus tubingensis CBS 134.48]